MDYPPEGRAAGPVHLGNALKLPVRLSLAHRQFVAMSVLRAAPEALTLRMAPFLALAFCRSSFLSSTTSRALSYVALRNGADAESLSILYRCSGVNITERLSENV